MTDERITDHPFQPGTPPLEPTECGWDDDGLPCGYSRDEHVSMPSANGKGH